MKAAEQDTWATLDWTDPLTRIFYGKSESTLNRMTSAGASLLLRGEVQETEEVIAKIEAVTAADVLATARAVLDTEKISYSAVGNLKGNDFGALVEKGITPGERNLIDALPEALATTDRICSSINVASTRSGINMDAVALLGQRILDVAEATPRP